jgi:cellulose synthase/poly-beta-1,6-N-acetylglucosamine synthase-like glycosyltransferase
VIALFAASLLLVAYTYAGYPLLLTLLARLRPLRSLRDEGWRPMVSVLVPYRNAGSDIDRKLDSLLALDWPAERLEILLFSDGSTDDSDGRVQRRAAGEPRLRPLASKTHGGKPKALNAMFQAARGEVLLMTDVRQPLAKHALRELTAMLADPAVGCVTGRLELEGSAGAGAYWRYERWIRAQEGRFRGLVGVTGAIYVVRKCDLVPLPADLLLDDMWIPMRLRLSGRRILMCDAARAFDRVFDDEREFSRKVRTLAGNFQLLALLPRLLSPFQNPSWFEFVSHKILRLVCPYALLTLLFASMLRRSLWPAAAAQIGGYALAAAGAWAGKLGTLARTFVVLNAAAVVAAWRFARGTVRW